MNSNFTDAATVDLMGRGQTYDDTYLRKRVTCLGSGLLLCFIIGGAGLGVSIIVLLKYDGMAGIFPEYAANQTEHMKALKVQLVSLQKQVETLNKQVMTIQTNDVPPIETPDVPGVGDDTLDIDAPEDLFVPSQAGGVDGGLPAADHEDLSKGHKHHTGSEAPASNHKHHHMTSEDPPTGHEHHHMSNEDQPTGHEHHHMSNEDQPTGHEHHHMSNEDQPTGHEHHHMSNEDPPTGHEHHHMESEDPPTGHDHHHMEHEQPTTESKKDTEQERPTIRFEEPAPGLVLPTGHESHEGGHDHHFKGSPSSSPEEETKLTFPSINELLCDDSDDCQQTSGFGSGDDSSGDGSSLISAPEEFDDSEHLGGDHSEGSGGCIQFPRPLCPPHFEICFSSDPCPIPTCCLA